MYQAEIAPGLYLAVQPNPRKGVDHYAIVDIGNRLRDPDVPVAGAAIAYHLTRPRLRRDFVGPRDRWRLMGRVRDELGAAERLRVAAGAPLYNLLFNNCEQFARYVATGVRESKQLQTATAWTCLVALAAVALVPAR